MEAYRFYFLNMTDRIDGFRDTALGSDAQAVAHAKTLLVSMRCEGVEVWQAGRFIYLESNLPTLHGPRAGDHSFAQRR